MTRERHLQRARQEFFDTLKRRGIKDKRVLDALEAVPREAFVSVHQTEFAYDDNPLPIEEGQTISQPYIVALMTEAMQLDPEDTVLEIGTGSGYAAAVLSRIVKQVYTVERHPALAKVARQRLAKLGYDNVAVLCGDGSLGWPEHAPYDAIVVTAGAPSVPGSLVRQLDIGGRLVIPAGAAVHQQRLLRVTRISEDKTETEDLGGVRFVPLIGKEGWQETEGGVSVPPPEKKADRPASLSGRIKDEAIHISSIATADLEGLLERIGDSRLVLLGEASHGTAEFYDMRARITRELIEKKGFRFVAVEADWPDAAQVDHFVRDTRKGPTEEPTFRRFPTWMWANRQVLEFVQWLRGHNRHTGSEDDAVGFYGLDLYSLNSSINAIIGYLEQVDGETADIARKRYGCLTPWERDPVTYGRLVLSAKHGNCEQDVVSMLDTLMQKRLDYSQHDGRKFLDAISNARLVKDAERYYRSMYQGSVKSWNLRDQHMFDTLEQLLDFHGPDSKAVVWAHNSHLGDAEATEMGNRGEINVGSLCRQRFGDSAYLIGFGTHEGKVAAASDWGAPMEIKSVVPSLPGSIERLCHDTGLDAFFLPLRHGSKELARQLREPRLERAIGVIYRPETEMASHYFNASLSRQFDEYIWFDKTRAVDALELEAEPGVPETFPFGL
ncbi:protein-L-isoaspartate O-methyltransferase [Marinobacter vulgaris]|uniref:Protein-L-isoaspartate O-methyltransferase n=1 Tax=Marinobacter vulgaris TaxID=1928331 RepID=A0A2V3ZZY9_9GAMM|nr:protein-L-isoaspartate(D-aspartate) O-methyltransferase [Marinobacter vulgaris]PXX91700.1 protein-L-isoaspartate O-methyltransferase [Marinobacter vulgaris]TSJ70796.1 protein-L-isoaspartate(D-aspartate) O-methyltransferase [Marinobacter vulgaris]